jgi:hypothetical protein
LAWPPRPTKEDYPVNAAEQTGFLGWTVQYGQFLRFYIEIVYFIVLSAAALWAAKTFSRYVKYMTTEEAEVVEYEDDEAADVSESVESDETKSVDEFVE